MVGLPGQNVLAHRAVDRARGNATELRALNWLKSKFKLTEILDLGKAALDAPEASLYPEHLERMQLTNPEGLKEDLFQRLLLTGLKATTQTP